jgi:hypothetical protein
MTTRPVDPRITEFKNACESAGTTPLAVVQEAGLHRTAWFRWKSGKVSPNFRKWDAVQRALERVSQGRAA